MKIIKVLTVSKQKDNIFAEMQCPRVCCLNCVDLEYLRCVLGQVFPFKQQLVCIFSGCMEGYGYKTILQRNFLPFINAVFPDGH